MRLFFLLSLCCSSAFAMDAASHAEAARLSGELLTLSERGAWGGAERMYLAASRTGVPLGHEAHVAGAESALEVGDIGTARDRLIAAVRERESREVIERLWEIDTQWGEVVLTVSPDVDLVVAVPAFDPIKTRAVKRAQAQMAQLGEFSGWLPTGHYTVGGRVFTVEAGESVEVDVEATKRRR
jgi:hypothetical protein